MDSIVIDDSGLDELIEKLRSRSRHLDSITKRRFVNTDSIMTSRPYLHQNSDEISEEESALLEQSNPEIIKFLQYLKESTFKFFG